MTNNYVEVFENDFFKKLRKTDKKCLSIIDNNSKIINEYYFNKDLPQVKKFVDEFNNIIIDPKTKKYELFEKALNHNLFTAILAHFRESDVLVKACRDENKKAVKWLITMNINFGVQDARGMTALMYAVQNTDLDFAVKTIIESNGKHIMFVDNEGNTALFHATRDIYTLRKILKYKDHFNPNHLNNKNENVILYSSSHRKIRTLTLIDGAKKETSVDYIVTLKQLGCTEPNISDINGKTAAMYLVENGKYDAIEFFVKDFNIDPNYVNKYGNSLVSVLMNKYYDFFTRRIVEEKGFGLNCSYLKEFAYLFKSLVKLGCNFNNPIDKEGTTVAMILYALKDDITSEYLLNKGAIDVSYGYIQNQSKCYKEIDYTNKIAANNLKTMKKWLKETYYDGGNVDTHKLGVFMTSVVYAL